MCTRYPTPYPLLLATPNVFLVEFYAPGGGEWGGEGYDGAALEEVGGRDEEVFFLVVH